MAATFVPATGVLIDTDVLIWYARGNAHAIATVNAIEESHISAVSFMELMQGCRTKAELRAIHKAFRSEAHDVLPLTHVISDLACKLVEQYALSYSVHVADALIASTAITHQLVLLTGNDKHFSAIKGLQLEVFRP